MAEISGKSLLIRKRLAALKDALLGKKKAILRDEDCLQLFDIQECDSSEGPIAVYCWKPKLAITLRVGKPQADAIPLEDLISHRDKEGKGIDNTGNVKIWPSEEVLAHTVLRHSSLFAGKKVIELGSGKIGLAGLACGLHCNPTEVAVTDGNAKAVSQLKRTVAVGLQERPAAAPQIIVDQLLWDKTVTKFSVSAMASVFTEGKESTLKDFSYSQHFDVILCADCFFFESFHVDLLHTCRWLVKPRAKEEGKADDSPSVERSLRDSHAWFVAPSRGGSLERFIAIIRAFNESSDATEVVYNVFQNFDSLVDKEVESLSERLKDQFLEDKHRPQLVTLCFLEK